MLRTCAVLLLATIVVLSSGCRAPRSSQPVNEAEIRRQVNAALEQMSHFVTAQDIIHASHWIHAEFVLNEDVAARFKVGSFEGQGPQAFREFFDRVADRHEDLFLEVTVHSIVISGSIATAQVTVHFMGKDFGPPPPPPDIEFEERDVMTFEWDRGHYRLRTWSGDPHSQGVGGSF